MNRIHPGGFAHNLQSLRVVDVLEDGGLNLTWEVRDGIKCHPWRETPSTEEGRCVQIADRIAYVNHDIDDAIRGGVLKPQDLPAEAIEVLGQTHGKRINTLVNAVIAESLEKGRVSLSGDCLEALDVLRQFLFDHVYIDSPAKKEEDKAKGVVEALYRYYSSHPEKIRGSYAFITETAVRACDYVSGMTDRFAIAQYRLAFVPSTWGLDPS